MDDMLNHPPDSGEMHSAVDKKQERTAFRKRVLQIGGAVALVLVGLFTLPVPLGTLKIEGSRKVTVQDVMVAGDIDEPVNILRIGTEKLKTRLAKDLRVEEAQIHYEFPLTLVIKVVERKAVAVIPAQFGYLTLDRQGQVIASEPAVEDTSVPMISGVKAGNILLGDTVKDPAISSVLEYLKSLDDTTFHMIAEVNVGNPDQLLAYTVSGIQIRLGDGKDMKAKAELTESMLKDTANTQGDIQYIDVNISSPYIKTDKVPDTPKRMNGAAAPQPKQEATERETERQDRKQRDSNQQDTNQNDSATEKR